VGKYKKKKGYKEKEKERFIIIRKEKFLPKCVRKKKE
jgi:hypothetical protein